MTEDINEIVLTKIFNGTTESSYLNGKVRFYVTKYNEGHFIHYFFTYNPKFATLHYFISTQLYDQNTRTLTTKNY
jgi:hypothetical protein